jgi:predicted acyl esterase
VPTWTDFTRHPNYDTFWQRQAFAPYLNAVKLPIIHVAGWWDQEDFYGPQKIYELMERHDAERRNYFVAGPWNHGGWNGNGKKLGAIDFGSDTAAYYREKIFQPWFDHWLRGKRARGNWPRRRCSRRGRTSGGSMRRGRRSAAWRRGGCISARAGGWRSTRPAGAGSMST